ncbi:hypothetical protein [Streptomyces sp. NPDC054838]
MHSVTPAQSLTVRSQDRDTDALEGRRATLDALTNKGLAVHVPGARRTYLTEAGRELRARRDNVPFTPAPPLEESVLDALGFRVYHNAWVQGVPEPVGNRRAEAELAWQAVLGQRRLYGQENIPAPWELDQCVRAVSLALEAHGQQSAARDEYGKTVQEGYRVEDARQPGSARVSYKTPHTWTAVGDPERREGPELARLQADSLSSYMEILTRCGWTCNAFQLGSPQAYLIASPCRA